MSTQRTCLNACDKIRKRDRLHKLGTVIPEGELLAYFSGGKDLLYGYKKSSHIVCYCCDRVVSASQFEKHAGFGSRRKPFSYIRVVSSKMTLQKLEKRHKGGEQDVQKQDNHSNACNKLHCSGCLKSFHIEPTSLTEKPHSEWLCTSCENATKLERNNADRNVNSQEAAADKKVDSVEQISNQDVQTEHTKCYLCRGIDFENVPFGPRTMLLCDQCDREYHVDCLKTHNVADLKELPEDNWFCSISCRQIHSSLETYVKNGTQTVPQSVVLDFDLTWRLLNGQVSFSEEPSKQLLKNAICVLQKAFGRLSCGTNGRGLIPPIVYGNDKEFYGMHCAVLLLNSKIVSVGVFRLFGQELAELPLVTTVDGYRRKGFFSVLFDIICGVCESHNVKSIVLPATETAKHFWLNRGFKKMTQDQVSAKREFFPNIVQFSDVIMLEKKLAV